MEAEDLMIGDLVLANKKPIHVTLATLQLIREDDTFAKLLRPIQLTEEILEKNGFLKDSGGEDLWICDDITVDFDGENFEFSILGEHREFNGCIQYVHELQHAFKLCGIEKEIIL